MKLFYTKGACSLAIRIILNELGLSFAAEAVNLKTKQTETGADYIKINAKGSVPALELDNGVIITENAVIQQYLAETHQAYNLLPEVGDAKRYQVLAWLSYISSELHKNCTPIFNANMPDDVRETILRPLLKTKLQFVEKHIEHTQSYLTGLTFTLPDSYLFTVLTWLGRLNINLADFPGLHRYALKLQDHPSVKLALEQEGLGLPIK